MKTAFKAKIIYECDLLDDADYELVSLRKIYKAIREGKAEIVEVIDDRLTNDIEPVIVFRNKSVGP